MSKLGWLVLVGLGCWIVLNTAICYLLDRWEAAEQLRQDEERKRLDKIITASHLPPRASGLRSDHRRVS